MYSLYCMLSKLLISSKNSRERYRLLRVKMTRHVSYRSCKLTNKLQQRDPRATAASQWIATFFPQWTIFMWDKADIWFPWTEHRFTFVVFFAQLYMCYMELTSLVFKLKLLPETQVFCRNCKFVRFIVVQVWPLTPFSLFFITYSPTGPSFINLFV